MTIEEARSPKYCEFCAPRGSTRFMDEKYKLVRFTNANLFRFACTWCARSWSFPRTGKGSRARKTAR
jgi:hypothetical protein